MKWIEGNVQEGNKVVIVDDVVTTGQSTIDAIEQSQGVQSERDKGYCLG